MRVGVVVRSLDASARVRVLQFVPSWRAAGVDVRVVAWDAPRGRAAVARRVAEVVALGWWADVVVLQKPVLPVAAVRALAGANRRLVVDLDDATWVGAGDRAVSPARATRVAGTLGLAAAVVAGSEHLAGTLADLAPGCDPRVLRPAVGHAAVGRAAVGRAAVGRAAPRPVVAGWVGSPGNLRDFTPAVRAALGALVDERTLEVRVVSSEEPRLGFPVTFVPWVAESELREVAAFDVGLMPLADDPRSAGRCGYKAILAMAAGRPVVASPVGCAAELVQPGTTGYLAGPPCEWRAALRLLAGDAALRDRLGAAGRSLVAAEADADRTGVELLAVLAEVAARPRWWG